MFTIEMNKIAGAVLGSLVLALGLGFIGQLIFTHGPLKTPGYKLPTAAAEAPKEAAAGSAVAAPLPVRLAKADAAKGEGGAKACQACHSFDKGGAAKVGPPLYGIVNRGKGAVAGFAYSEAMKGKGGAWGFEELDTFITNPKGYVSGTKMAYAGEGDAQKRADIIVYLRGLSENPPPLPAADKN